MPKPIIKQTEQGPILTDGELSLQINFFSSQHNYRRQTAGIKNQLIAKAVGIKGDYRPYIIDATAGLGRDAFVLASLGCKVLMLEQSTELNILLQHALQAAEKKQEIHRIIQGMSLIETNSIDYFKSLKKEDYPEVIYLDPMFPERKKSALVKKEMQLLQKLLDKTEDNTLLLD